MYMAYSHRVTLPNLVVKDFNTTLFPMQPNILLHHTARRGWSRVVGEGGTVKSKEGKVHSVRGGVGG